MWETFKKKIEALPVDYKLSQEDITSIGCQDTLFESVKELTAIYIMHNLKLPSLAVRAELAREYRSIVLIDSIRRG